MDRPLFSSTSRWRFLALWVGALMAAGCGGDQTASTAAPPKKTSGVASANSSGGSDAADDRYQTTSRPAGPLVRINTSLGPIDVRLDQDAAPLTVRNFLNHAQSRHYDGTTFHYVEKDKFILGGGYTWVDGAPIETGEPIRSEAENGRKNTRGTLAMARDANVIDSATTQFFINLEDAPHLDYSGDAPDEYGYCVFGDVVKGLEVAEQIAATPTEKQVVDGEEQNVPTLMVRIESVEVLREELSNDESRPIRMTEKKRNTDSR